MKKTTLRQKKSSNPGGNGKSRYAAKLAKRIGQADAPLPVLHSKERVAIDGNDGSVPAEASLPGDGLYW